MDSKDLILDTMKKAGKPMSNSEIAQAANLDKKEVEKVMKKLKTEGLIESPVRCYWQPKS
jgi:DNA-binding IscR family transcriptional regulator